MVEGSISQLREELLIKQHMMTLEELCQYQAKVLPYITFGPVLKI